jgi:ribosomal protein S18 acetylase RimI-like enzyme
MLSDEVIDACEAIYARKGLPPIFRVPALIDQTVDGQLAARGYGLEGRSLTLFAPARSLAAAPDPEVELTRRPTEAWLRARFRISGLNPDDAQTYRRVLARLTVAAVFAALRAEDRIVAVAYGAELGGLLCLESVATDPGFRGRGLASRLLRALFAKAMVADFEGVCLQVEADNAPAIRLYRSLGVGDQLYGYHYRRGRPLERSGI